VGAAQARATRGGMTLGRSEASLAALDHATRALYSRVRAAPQNRALWEALEGCREARRAFARDLRIVLVPGILYRDFPRTGADGTVVREIAAQLGIPFDTVPVDGTEGLERAADLIIARLLAVPEENRVLLFSLSKGSAEVRHALGRHQGRVAFRRVHAWISVSGLPFGTPTAEMVLRRPLARAWLSAWFWLRHWRLERVRELLFHRPGASLEIPPHLQFVQIAAFPLHSQLRDRRSRRFQRRLAAFGPNDGFAVLGELAALPGSLYPVWGADHYLRGGPDVSVALSRLIEYLSGSLDPPDPARCYGP
jgi:hypothetical protein